MDLSLFAILEQVGTYPMLAVIIILVLLVTVVSGATDAPNAIATAVSTRCLKVETALWLAAIFNFVGLIGMTFISTAVAHTMFNMVDLSGDSHMALMALTAAMIGAICWGVFCWFFGIPCSKSHALIAGITGGAIALNGLGGVVIGEWAKVIYGMVFSLVAGFILGMFVSKGVSFLFARFDRKKSNNVCAILTDICAILLSCLHGAQDGQKFMSIAVMGIMLSFGMDANASEGFPLWLMITCSVCISAGTFIGGKRIIKAVAMDMVKLEKWQGVSASATTVTTLLVSSLTGMPVSTSHCSTAAIMGVGAGKSLKSVKWDSAGKMCAAWILTFPACGVIGFVLASIFMLF